MRTFGHRIKILVYGDDQSPTIRGGEHNLFSVKQKLNWFLIWLLLLQMGSKTFEKGFFFSFFFFFTQTFNCLLEELCCLPLWFLFLMSLSLSHRSWHYVYCYLESPNVTFIAGEKWNNIKNDKSWHSAGSLSEGKTENEKMNVDQWASVRCVFGRNL